MNKNVFLLVGVVAAVGVAIYMTQKKSKPLAFSNSDIGKKVVLTEPLEVTETSFGRGDTLQAGTVITMMGVKDDGLFFRAYSPTFGQQMAYSATGSIHGDFFKE